MQQIQYEMRPGEYADAMRSARGVRMALWLGCGAAIFVQVAAFLLVEYGGVLGPAGAGGRRGAAASATAATRPAGAAAAARPTTAGAARGAAAAAAAPAAEAPSAEQWKAVLSWLLPACKFGGLVLAFLLTATLWLAVLLSLVGRLGGIGGLVGALFWSLLLLAMLVPWQNVLPGSSLACGALFNLGDLLSARAAAEGWTSRLVYFGRFLAYPLAAAAVWLIVHLRFGAGCAKMDFPHGEPAAGGEVVVTGGAAGGGTACAEEGAKAQPVGGESAATSSRPALSGLAQRFFRARQARKI